VSWGTSKECFGEVGDLGLLLNSYSANLTGSNLQISSSSLAVTFDGSSFHTDGSDGKFEFAAVLDSGLLITGTTTISGDAWKLEYEGSGIGGLSAPNKIFGEAIFNVEVSGSSSMSTSDAHSTYALVVFENVATGEEIEAINNAFSGNAIIGAIGVPASQRSTWDWATFFTGCGGGAITGAIGGAGAGLGAGGIGALPGAGIGLLVGCVAGGVVAVWTDPDPSQYNPGAALGTGALVGLPAGYGGVAVVTIIVGGGGGGGGASGVSAGTSNYIMRLRTAAGHFK